MLAALRAQNSRLRVVDSPRHADLLLVIEPVSEKLIPAIADAYRAIPEPKRITAASGRITTR